MLLPGMLSDVLTPLLPDGIRVTSGENEILSSALGEEVLL
jgi:hypothetical protein